MYEWLKEKASSKSGEMLVYLLCFFESFISPLTPDLFIAIVLLNKREAWKRIVTSCVLISVLGGLIGYCIGAYSFEYLGQHIVSFFGGEEKFTALTAKMNKYAFFVIAFKGFLPVPFKLVAIASGVMHVNLLIFIIAAIICRTTRFLLIGYLCHRYGEEVMETLDKNSSYFGWLILISIVIGIGLLFIV